MKENVCLADEVIVDSQLNRLEFAELRETAVRDFLAGLVFVAMVMAPCVLALTVDLHDMDSK